MTQQDKDRRGKLTVHVEARFNAFYVSVIFDEAAKLAGWYDVTKGPYATVEAAEADIPNITKLLLDKLPGAQLSRKDQHE